MAIEALLERIAVGLEANTAVLQILNAGREASLEQLKKAGEAGEAAPARATRKKKADEAPAVTETATAPTAVPPAAAAAPVDGLSALETELKAAVTAHIEGTTVAEEKAARVADIQAIMAHFGGKLVGPQSTLDDDQKAQALFYVRRYAAGLPVDFSQDYDFAGDPTQGGLEPAGAAADAGDDFDIG